MPQTPRNVIELVQRSPEVCCDDENVHDQNQDFHLRAFDDFVPSITNALLTVFERLGCVPNDESYRGFDVVSGMVGYNSEGIPNFENLLEPGEIQMSPLYKPFFGANLKPLRHGPKVCAEQGVISQMRFYGIELVPGIVGIGPPQEQGPEKVVLSSLMPRNDCRVFAQYLKMFRPWTRVIAINPFDTGKSVVAPLDEVLKGMGVDTKRYKK